MHCRPRAAHTSPPLPMCSVLFRTTLPSEKKLNSSGKPPDRMSQSSMRMSRPQSHTATPLPAESSDGAFNLRYRLSRSSSWPQPGRPT